ncbi:metallophosphoesterase family protein [Flavobacterium qiangtangense]|uniref:Metallophosphoesterase family protein n=1 Tax=Flavobacterium qiangtangense TaxID=1442595 RepID=A0ABW1PSG9_9FLAO
MRVVVFGDVHGNLIALEKLFQIEKTQADLFISHGDVVNYGPWSNECVALLESVDNIKLLRGNHEQSYIEGFYDGKNVIAKSFFDFCYSKFDRNLMPEISRYENQIHFSEFIVQHTIDNRYIFADTNINDLKIDCNYIIGHSHQQYELQKDNFKIYNTGSLGQNRELLNVSCYLAVDTDKKTVERKNFIHDIDKVINKMEAERYPQICLDYYKGKKKA